MRIHPADKIEEIKRLRQLGYSINELVANFQIPKTTIWHHVHRVPVLPEFVPVWMAKRGGGAKRSERGWEVARSSAKDLLSGPNREIAIATVMLYWGEGSKKACEFINSNGSMIRCYLAFLRDAVKVPESEIHPTMRYFGMMDRNECLAYWSDITQIPPGRFIVRYNDGSTKGRTKYGLCRITVGKGGQQLLKTIRVLIDSVAETIGPRSSTDRTAQS